MTHTRRHILIGLLAPAAASILLVGGASAAPADLQGPPTAGAPAAEELLSGWIVDEADNVCGVRSARQITSPARVRYDELLETTPELKRMKREGIDRDSAKGQVLYAAGVDRVRKAASRVMGNKSHCSVWKTITHRDGRTVPDITDDVMAEL